MIMRNLIGGVGTQFTSPERAIHALNCRRISPVFSFSFEIPIFPQVILFYLYPCFLNLCSALFLLVLFWFDAYLLLCMICTLKFFYLKFSSYIFWSCTFASQTHLRSFSNSLLTQLHVLSLLSQIENKKNPKNLFTSTPLKTSIIYLTVNFIQICVFI